MRTGFPTTGGAKSSRRPYNSQAKIACERLEHDGLTWPGRLSVIPTDVVEDDFIFLGLRVRFQGGFDPCGCTVVDDASPHKMSGIAKKL